MTNCINNQINNYAVNHSRARQQFQNGYDDESGSIVLTSKHQDRKLFIKTPKILLVEDTEIIQKVNMHYLEFLGCKADLAKDGFEAIELFQNDYDLILLDIKLPSKNGIKKTGIDVASEIRRFEVETGTRRNIIIALTALGDTILDECMAAGCDDFYKKPLLLDPLSEVLQRWLPHLANKSSKAPVSCAKNEN